MEHAVLLFSEVPVQTVLSDLTQLMWLCCPALQGFTLGEVMSWTEKTWRFDRFGGLCISLCLVVQHDDSSGFDEISCHY